MRMKSFILFLFEKQVIAIPSIPSWGDGKIGKINFPSFEKWPCRSICHILISVRKSRWKDFVGPLNILWLWNCLFLMFLKKNILKYFSHNQKTRCFKNSTSLPSNSFLVLSTQTNNKQQSYKYAPESFLSISQ